MKRLFVFLLLAVLVLGIGVSTDAFGVSWEDLVRRIEEKTGTGMLPALSLPGGVRVVTEESVVIDVVEKVSPSVVTVSVERERPIMEFGQGDPFGLFPIPRQRGTELEETDIGSGFIISPDGLIVTNKHVVSDPQYSYNVITSDNQSHDVERVYRDPVNDLAILKIDAGGLTPIEMGDSDALKVGQLVVALGTPLGEFRGSVTKGIVSGLGRGITAGSPFEGMAEELDGVIQTDAAINPGNSGGPLVNSAGQVIGVNTAVASGAENIGFALPINIVKEAVANFEETGSFDRAFLGVSYRMITRDLSVMNDIPEGAYILEVIEGSVAAKAGIKRGDIITHFDGMRLNEQEQLSRLINKKKIGDKVDVTIWRNTEEKELNITLGEYEEE